MIQDWGIQCPGWLDDVITDYGTNRITALISSRVLQYFDSIRGWFTVVKLMH